MEESEIKKIKKICKKHKLKLSVMRDVVDLRRELFNNNEVCDELGLSKPTITHYIQTYKQYFKPNKELGITK